MTTAHNGKGPAKHTHGAKVESAKTVIPGLAEVEEIVRRTGVVEEESDLREIESIVAKLGDEGEEVDDKLSGAEVMEALPESEKGEAVRLVERLREEAMAIPADQVEPFRWSAARVKRNVDLGYANLRPHFDALAQIIRPDLVDRARRVPQLALALIYAAAIAERTSPPPTETVREAMKRLYSFRRLFIHSALAWVEKNRVDKEYVEGIRRGTGSEDALNDTVTLAHFFANAPDLRKRTPIDEDDPDTAIRLAASLYSRLNLDGAPPLAEELVVPTDPNIDLRDRLWTLLKEEWNVLYGVASMHYHSRVEEFIPSLHSRTRVRVVGKGEGREGEERGVEGASGEVSGEGAMEEGVS